MKSTYEALITMAKDVPTTVIWENHDYKLWKKVKIPVRATVVSFRIIFTIVTAGGSICGREWDTCYIVCW